MDYRAVKDRCAVDLRDMPSKEVEHALRVLEKKGFEVVEIDIVALARSMMTRSTYRLGALFAEAPEYVDCSSFTKWLYGARGIYLPRRALQQRDIGYPVAIEEMVAGDLIFSKGCQGYYRRDPTDDVGHVGIVTGNDTVIHACSKSGLIEGGLEAFTAPERFRGVRRYIPLAAPVVTLRCPPGTDVESSDDICLLLLGK
ncbi:MAG TPA: NlpC/P60 family protein [Candidatus Paceibacterota bacterium]|jgi:hypothetical protein|nr:NlpC/P60 family protein [Candidatus Paceibacterota bacterium]